MTKSKGNKDIARMHNEIQREFRKMREQGRRSNFTIQYLADKYFRCPGTIKNIVYKKIL